MLLESLRFAFGFTMIFIIGLASFIGMITLFTKAGSQYNTQLEGLGLLALVPTVFFVAVFAISVIANLCFGA